MWNSSFEPWWHGVACRSPRKVPGEQRSARGAAAPGHRHGPRTVGAGEPLGAALQVRKPRERRVRGAETPWRHRQDGARTGRHFQNSPAPLSAARGSSVAAPAVLVVVRSCRCYSEPCPPRGRSGAAAPSEIRALVCVLFIHASEGPRGLGFCCKQASGRPSQHRGAAAWGPGEPQDRPPSSRVAVCSVGSVPASCQLLDIVETILQCLWHVACPQASHGVGGTCRACCDCRCVASSSCERFCHPGVGGSGSCCPCVITARSKVAGKQGHRSQ